ncbi:MAG: aminoglycoside phosphotransferase family protein [Parasphingopyxis sp.]|uniref:aminoglycoside phosphotransferase family protein n=1 Tax=Parasphingopyxis sp. TaxID=1920299 RepID=UPI003FA01100
MPSAPHIDTPLVRRLIERQFPDWADRRIEPILPGGWDNRNFRLGADMVVRLPSAERYASQVEKEHVWLPRLAPALPVSIPEPLAMGRPDVGYPCHWSIYGWLEGATARRDRIADPSDFAVAIADFLNALHSIDTDGGPEPGPHNFYRGGPLSIYDAQTREAIMALGNAIDAPMVAELWEMALASPWSGPPVWVHGDLMPGNILVKAGRLHAVIDFGCCAIGDPACDLVMAWTFFEEEERRRFRDALNIDDGTWHRARGWALWKALIVLAGLSGTNRAERETAGATLNRILAGSPTAM